MQAVDSARLTLAEYESSRRTGTKQTASSHFFHEIIGARNPLSGLQQRLRNDEALIAFHLSEPRSFRWAVTKNGVQVDNLPAASSLAGAVRRLRNEVQFGKAGGGPAASELYTLLFGGLDKKARGKSTWVIAPDGVLFEAPLAATQTGGKYLAELREIRLLAAGATAPPASVSEPVTNRFTGFADPIYNAADRRWRGERRAQARLQLTRLPSSAREVQRCANVWGLGSARVVTGDEVQWRTLAAALAERPAVLHLAGHVIRHPKFADQVMIPLGLQGDGQMDFVTPADIATRKGSAGLVTLSGCESGSGASSGLGLLGLTRAWLQWGARAVAASYWAVPDDDGRLFEAMYRALKKEGPAPDSRTASRALRQAQLEMIRSRTAASHPAYWSAFFVVGKD